MGLRMGGAAFAVSGGFLLDALVGHGEVGLPGHAVVAGYLPGRLHDVRAAEPCGGALREVLVQADHRPSTFVNVEGEDANDSAYVQFSDSVTSTGQASYRIGSTAATIYTIEDCSGCGVSGWGWNDNYYGSTAGTLIYFATTGTHTIRVQVREDGLSLDQIVLSPVQYRTTAPGLPKNDADSAIRTSGSPSRSTWKAARTGYAISVSKLCTCALRRTSFRLLGFLLYRRSSTEGLTMRCVGG